MEAEEETLAVSDATHAHVVVVLSGPREGTSRETNANFERIRRGLRLAHKYRATLILSGHPDEGALLAREMIDTAMQENVAADMHVDLYARHTVGNALFTLVKARSRFTRDSGVHLTIHVVTSEWHMPRARTIFRAIFKRYTRHDPYWHNFSCRLQFHGARPETSPTCTHRWRMAEIGKMMETPAFLSVWEDPERLLRMADSIKDNIVQERIGQSSLISVYQEVELQRPQRARMPALAG